MAHFYDKHKKSSSDTKLEDFLMPQTGLEPVRCCHRGILSPLRLPIPPLRHMFFNNEKRPRRDSNP